MTVFALLYVLVSASDVRFRSCDGRNIMGFLFGELPDMLGIHTLLLGWAVGGALLQVVRSRPTVSYNFLALTKLLDFFNVNQIIHQFDNHSGLL